MPLACPVLIVDDVATELTAIARLLEAAGFEPPFTTIEGGCRAKELLAEQGGRFGIAFFDLRMPTTDGLQLLTWVRSRPELARLKVIIITADNDPGEIQRVRAAGADGYFTKYPSAPKLAAILANIVPGLVASSDGAGSNQSRAPGSGSP